MFRIAYVSPDREVTDQEKVELRRIFGEGGTLVFFSPEEVPAERLLEGIRHADVDAVVMVKTHNPHSFEVRKLRSEMPVVERYSVTQETNTGWRGGRNNVERRMTSKPKGFGLSEGGSVKPLADGELAYLGQRRQQQQRLAEIEQKRQEQKRKGPRP